MLFTLNELQTISTFSAEADERTCEWYSCELTLGVAEKCLQAEQICNFHTDCVDGKDELNCGKSHTHLYNLVYLTQFLDTFMHFDYSRGLRKAIKGL